jgi:lysozyme family protein
MAVGGFEKCHPITAKWEGGWSDHPADPGGKTMYGVTEAVYHAWLRRQGRKIAPVRTISKIDALAIYRSVYWDAIGGDGLAAGVDLATYDAAVNSGPARAKKWLLASVGGTAVQTVKRICATRLSFVSGLRTWKTFGKGWSRRIADIEAKGVAMALSVGAVSKTEVKSKLEAEAKSAQKSATKDVTGAGGVVATPVAVDQATDQIAGIALAGFIGIAVLVAIVLIWRARVNKHRMEAYLAEAAK